MRSTEIPVPAAPWGKASLRPGGHQTRGRGQPRGDGGRRHLSLGSWEVGVLGAQSALGSWQLASQ